MTAGTDIVIRTAELVAEQLEADIKRLRAELATMTDMVEAAGDAECFTNYKGVVRRARKLLRETAP